MMKPSLEKQPMGRQTLILSLTLPETKILTDLYPAAFFLYSGKSMGFWRLNWLHLKGQSIDAVQVGDKRKARSLQKLILKSQAAKLLAIRQVTQLNAGKKTAGIDGKKSLSFEERFALANELRQHQHNWKHEGRLSRTYGDKFGLLKEV